MPNLPPTAHTARGIFERLDVEWEGLCADTSVQAAVTDWLVADRLADDVAAVTDSWVRGLGPAQLLAALRPPNGAVTDALTDAVLRALLRRAAGRDRSATLAARVIVQAMIPAAVRMTRGQVRPFGGRTFDDIGHMTIAALYVVARSGRIHTRPGRPAANLALDTLRHVCRELTADREEHGEELGAAEDLADSTPGPAELAEAQSVSAAAAAAGLQPTGAVSEGEADRARLELLELVLDAMGSGTLSSADARAIAWHYTTDPVTDIVAATRTGTTAAAWQRRRSRAVARLSASLQLRPAA
ncbi:hypothetical protein [Streptomyces sp. NBC_00154]|uniref:hypothetical protein n=1 Tax=Streptomyces sp. NBC_00154 TaxID=2975670 RepID=UPI00225BF621|nr:hypothetical protein [Streptomyces sp. NBC_00154]MCX5317938.1 hypothetical protein [Streptomyces sp. NBC_00154]